MHSNRLHVDKILMSILKNFCRWTRQIDNLEKGGNHAVLVLALNLIVSHVITLLLQQTFFSCNIRSRHLKLNSYSYPQAFLEFSLGE